PSVSTNLASPPVSTSPAAFSSWPSRIIPSRAWNSSIPPTIMATRMELRHLRYFVAVAEELHFRRAAERLHMSQPPLSQQIRQLEEEVGATLLTRSQRKVELTAAGAAFLVRAREILDAVEDAARQARRVQ